MIYVCNHCGKNMPELTTPGEGVNTDLICPSCSKDVQNLLKSQREIQYSLEKHFQRLR